MIQVGLSAVASIFSPTKPPVSGKEDASMVLVAQLNQEQEAEDQANAQRLKQEHARRLEDQATKELIAQLNQDQEAEDQANAQGVKRLAKLQATEEAEAAATQDLLAQLQLDDERCEADARMAASLEQRTFECAICIEERSEEDVFTVDRCGHELCRLCMAQHVLSEVMSRNVPVRCPLCIGLEDVSELTETEAHTVLTGEQVTRYLDTSLANAVEQSESFHQCNAPDCKGGIFLEGDYARFQCPVCSEQRCVRCNVKWHHGQTCEQYKEWRAANDAGDDQMATLVNSGDVRVCFQCGNGVQKSEGCNHMTCRCRAHFCYLCDADIGNDIYGHFGEPPKCKLFTGAVYEDD